MPDEDLDDTWFRCPKCNSTNIMAFAPTAFGFLCRSCEHSWDATPPEWKGYE